jgi:small-conductance mechanosensitive channel
LSDILNVEERVRERRNTVGDLVGRITSRQELVSDILEQINDLGVTLRGRLLSRDAPPLWAAFGVTEQPPIAEEAAAVAREWFRTLFVYVRLNAGRIILSVIWFFVLLMGAFQLKGQVRDQAPEGEDSEEVRKLLARPYSIALVFALATALFIVRYPGGSATDLLMLLALVPMLRLGTIVLTAIPRRALYGVAALAVLGRVVSAGPDVSLSTRVLLLIVGLVGFLGTAWAAIHSRERVQGKGGWIRAAHILLSIAPVLLGVALAANVFGWVQLAKTLTEGTIASLLSALAWLVVAAAATVLMPRVIDGRLGQALPGLRRKRASVERVGIKVVTILAVFAWLAGTLIRFNGWAAFREIQHRIASSELAIGDLTISLNGLAGAVVILLATWLVSRLVRFFLMEEVLPRANLRRGDAQSVVTLVNYGVYAIGILVAASAIGLGGTQVAVVFGALSLGIGFGLQTIVNNFVSGLILIFERPIKVGDTVQTVDHFGKVQSIGIRASTIRSFDGAEIVIPNGDLVAKEVINWTRTDQIRRAEVLVGVAYGTDPELVLEILLRVAGAHPKVREDPEPQAQMIRFGDSSLDFRLRGWTLMDDYIGVLGDLHVAVNREIIAAGITIPFPQRDLHIIPPEGDGSPDPPPEVDTSDHPPLPDPSEGSD